MHWAAEIHQGLKRQNQEDTIGHWPEQDQAGALVLFLVADGLGGLAEGEVASRSAVQSVYDFVDAAGGISSLEQLEASVRVADEVVCCANAKRGEFERMATTLTACYFTAHEIWIAHVGDCRVYRIRGGSIEQLTRDHTLDRYTLTHALGFEENQDVETRKLSLEPKDLFVICSDGLYGMLSDEQILKITRREENIAQCARHLLRDALESGGHDNISVFVVKP